MGNLRLAAVSRYVSRTSIPDFFNDGTVQMGGDLIRLQEENWSGTVTSLTIYKTPLEQGPLQRKRLEALEALDDTELDRTLAQSLMPTIYHHFLVVEIADLWRPNGQHVNGPHRIRAEKVGRDANGENTGITVNFTPVVFGSKLIEKHKVAELGLSIPVAQLLEILARPSPNYDILSSNCWNYSHDTLVAILSALGELHPEEKHRMESQLLMVPPLVMPAEVIDQYAVYTVVVAAMSVLMVSVYRGLKYVFGSRQ